MQKKKKSSVGPKEDVERKWSEKAFLSPPQLQFIWFTVDFQMNGGLWGPQAARICSGFGPWSPRHTLCFISVMVVKADHLFHNTASPVLPSHNIHHHRETHQWRVQPLPAPQEQNLQAPKSWKAPDNQFNTRHQISVYFSHVRWSSVFF